jgi:cytochrome c
MKALRIIVICFITVGLLFIFAYKMGEIIAAEVSESEMAMGSVSKGKVLFNNPALGSSTNANSCNTCHPEGRGLEKAGEKKEFHIMGKKQESIEEAVNICIEMPLQGKALDPEGEDMANIVAYIKSLKK